MNTLLSIGSSGLHAAMGSLDRSAARVARAGATDPDSTPRSLAAEAVTQIEARHQFAANLQTVKTADALMGTLIDTFA